MTQQSTITTAQVIDAIESTLSAAAEVDYSQSYDELSEGIQDSKVLQVYWDASNQDAVNTTIDRTTFQAGVRQTDMTIIADYYAHRRGNLAEDMDKLVTGIDSIIAILEAQDTKPYFGLSGIKAFSWSAQRVTFSYGDATQQYMGARFTFIVRIF